MSAKGVISGSSLKTLKALQDAQEFFLEEKERTEGEISELLRAVQSFNDKVPFRTELLKPKTFGDFLSFTNPTQPMFNQMASEVPWWDLLDQIERVYFLQSPQIGRTRSFITDLWKGEVAKNPFKPPTGWKYLPTEEAVESYRKIFGSSMKADSVLKLAKVANPCQGNEGIAVWPKLSFLFYHFEIPKVLGISGQINPWDDTKEGHAAYAKIVEFLIPEVGKAYTKVYPQFSFKNWREGQLTADHIQLTPAGRKNWQLLEKMSDDDFVIASGGANTGSLYAGHSVRRSRIIIVLAINQFGQDAIMVGSTLAIQPARLSKYEHLGMDCPATKYGPAADGKFSDSVCFFWLDGGLHFGFHWSVDAFRLFGSASGSI